MCVGACILLLMSTNQVHIFRGYICVEVVFFNDKNVNKLLNLWTYLSITLVLCPCKYQFHDIFVFACHVDEFPNVNG